MGGADVALIVVAEVLPVDGAQSAPPASSVVIVRSVRAGEAGLKGICSKRRKASCVDSGIWLKRKRRFSPRKANNSMSVMPGSLAL